jgi:hypothetical protein
MSEERCKTCGCVRHSLPRYAWGWLCYTIYMALPEPIVFGRFWKAPNALLPFAGDYVYDRRGYCDQHHSEGTSNG